MKNRYLPFGYKIADGKIVADSEQVEAVRRIFDAYTAGQTFQQIADALSAQGIPYRSDASRWNKNMVSLPMQTTAVRRNTHKSSPQGSLKRQNKSEKARRSPTRQR